VRYGCNGCGYLSAQWLGFCPRCRDEAGLVPHGVDPEEAPSVSSVLDVASAEADHEATGLGELDRVLGGGIVPGAAILVAGEPGVGKSTLVLQAAAAISASGRPTLVASGEESPQQIASRAARVGAAEAALHVMAGGTVGDIVDAADAIKPAAVIIDSIQTVAPACGDAVSGSQSAVKLAAAELVGWGKTNGVAVLFVGHVNKEGAIAGPKVLEHAVDVVTYLEGDHHRDLRVLRCRKNRYGPTSRIGIFRLSERGMEEVADASELLVGSWQGDVAGSVAFPSMEGGRAIAVEVQALVARSPAPQQRRSVRGIDSARVNQIIAVLERHGGLAFGGHDVYVGVSGGLRVREPAADLPVALALASSLVGVPLGRIGAWGEVGLTGELRAVAHSEHRREEGRRIGLSGFLSPGPGGGRIEVALGVAGITVSGAEAA
jgi:DNA repair protein RadA/Sms